MPDRIYTKKELEARQELLLWIRKTPDNFTALLYELITKADCINRFKLSKVFPMECEAWQEWQNSDDAEGLLNDWNSVITHNA